jgi:hypothetical protein
LLVAGQPAQCPIKVSYQPNGANPVRAAFTYGLKYKNTSGEQTLPVPGTDRWEPTGGNVNFSQENDLWVFDLPIHVVVRQDRTYHTIEVTGILEFDNGTKRTIVEPLLIAQPSPSVTSSRNNSPNPPRSLTTPQSSRPTPSPTTSTPNPAQAKVPKFSQWSFSGCQSDLGPTNNLIAGRASRCELVIDYEDIGTQPLKALFTYTLEYTDDFGQTQELKLGGTDTWIPGGGNVTLADSGSSYIFTLPIAVKVRPERSYDRIVVLGSIFFEGGKKRVLEGLPIEYVPN